MEKKSQWSTRLESLVVLLGYSIGLPETWKLPFLVYRNGGGAFLIPYLVMIVFCGLPLYFLELALSQFSGKGPWRFWDICPLFRGFAITIAIVNIVTVTFDVAVHCWSFEYLISSMQKSLPWSSCDNWWNTKHCRGIGSDVRNYSGLIPCNESCITGTNFSSTTSVSSIEEFWMYKILRISSGIDDVGDINGIYVLYSAVVRIIIFCAIIKIVKTLGKMMIVTAFVPILLIIILGIRATFLTGATTGMLYFLSPDFNKLATFQIWIEAAFMAFNTLGPGWGGLMMIGCRNRFNFNCLRSAIISSSSVFVTGLLNGLVVFATVGVMAHETNTPVNETITAGGISIGFVAYPKALSFFPLPQVWCIIFYISLILPGIDGLTIMTEPFLLVLQEMFPRFLGNRRVVLAAAVSIGTFLLGIPFLTQAGVYIFQLFVWYTATWSIVLMCLVEAVILAWIYGSHRVDRDMKMMLGRPMPAFIRISLAFVMPIFLSTLLVISFYTYRPPTFGSYIYPAYATAIGWTISLLSVIPVVIYSVYLISKTKGSLKEKIYSLVRHNVLWKPSDIEQEKTFISSEKALSINLRDLIVYNFLGRFQKNMDLPEMEELNNC